ncbi:sulfate transporter family protein-like protein [Lindgomyces ingoldianus]|uniref:Sulfate transporter family protein-like protein n=1 Tax=Lindgomyces ingoldianus TaxID=673940 RepID=A0ACB6QYT0_9PLEO|nr:sulfate transporter family protein-like protein [Lindgomyces ingoldianus]KAF2472046.1 sulfate transporter family protein-like protein [Lindgomyces ingoldianus]
MTSCLLRRQGDSNSVEQQLPFTGDTVSDLDFSREQQTNQSDAGSNIVPRSRPIRAPSSTSASILSGSYTQRTPARSFAHHASHAAIDNLQYSSHGVRERTQELASYALDLDAFQSRPRRPSYPESDTVSTRRAGFFSQDTDVGEGRVSSESFRTEVIGGDDGVESPETVVDESRQGGRNFFSPTPYTEVDPQSQGGGSSGAVQGISVRTGLPNVVVQDTEATPLLPKPRLSRTDAPAQYKSIKPASSDHSSTASFRIRVGEHFTASREHLVGAGRSVLNPKNYTKDAAISGAITSLQTLSAVFLGLLLNVLDALSYGYILFPLGSPVFSSTGPDGISIFFVSCIVSQLCYSLGLSVFKGGVGSEMIEVVPFFHKMAYSIMKRMKGQSDEAIIATVIVSYCLSSIVTGLIFLTLGGFKLGSLVSFFPRHILIGCIGGVGFFLVVTGIEVSARLEGNLNYDFNTLHKLFSHDTVYLWLLPLVLAVIVLVMRRLIKSPFVLPIFFIIAFAIFYLIIKGILGLDLETVRNSGWIFEMPEAGVPFYRFYSYFKFGSIDGGALISTIPTMFALSFFGIIHVPINVPALGAAVKEDNVNVNRELIAHGISNTLSGLVGSIQNYLVYANSILFIENGGDSRAAGVLLAVATTAVWMSGPAMIGFIPICLVGALIFLLGIELLEEAVWDTFGKCHKLEYLTIIAIVLIMGVYDFVVGIFAGIVLACLSYVVQSSRTPAIRASYSGDVAESTVRRPRADRRYLSRVRGQMRVIKLSGFLFFGTIVSVEEYMRSLIEEDNFQKQPVSFIIVDFSHVTDADFSSSEGFQRINRILSRKHVKMIVSGISFASKVGQALQNVGLLDAEKAGDECPPPSVFEDLNTALEACENELLEAFYKHCSSSTNRRQRTPPISITPEGLAQHTPNSPGFRNSTTSGSLISSLRTNPLDPEWQSPRRGAQLLAAATTMREQGAEPNSAEADTPSAPFPSKWKSFAQPIKILLQTFEDVSAKNEDFWQIAAPYFQRKEYPAGTVLYTRGDEPDGFYILEKGRFRAEYELDQGHFYEVILPGTTCGELPFFSQTDRTGTVVAENDSTAWLLTREKYNELEERNRDVASELLKVGLKLTKERMDAITSYVLVTAS